MTGKYPFLLFLLGIWTAVQGNGTWSKEDCRCYEICQEGLACMHGCSKPSSGSVCFFPSNQTLDEDNKSCILLRAESAGCWKVGLIVAGVAGLVLLAVITLGTLKYRRTKRALTEGELVAFFGKDTERASVALHGYDEAALLPFNHVLSPDDISMDTGVLLGSGEFSVVHPGICKSKPVAIKVFKHSVDLDGFKAALSEVKIMEYLGDHDFIVKFVGAEISEIAERKIMIVTELSPCGTLQRYLWKVDSAGLDTQTRIYENVAGNSVKVTRATLYTWCAQIATAMEYLAEKGVIHGDLAARNVLVFNDHVVKIFDFGLSKHLNGCTSYRMHTPCKLPWKWGSIELLMSAEFSEGSDVWAFGVTAWEIFTLGQTPYKEATFSREFVQFLQDGHRLPKPVHASDEIYKVLLECWDSEKSKRPNFTRLKQVFNELLAVQRSESTKREENAMESAYVCLV